MPLKVQTLRILTTFGNITSEQFAIKEGWRQWGEFSPTLFTVPIDDITKKDSESTA